MRVSSTKYSGKRLFNFLAEKLSFDDASLSLSFSDVAITFGRPARSYAAAISSAITEIEAVSSVFVEAIDEDDYIMAPQIAQRVNRSRETVRLWAESRRRSGGFPKAVWRYKNKGVWRWSEVAEWLEKQKILSGETPRYARLTAAINAALATRRLRPKLPSEERKVISMILERPIAVELAASA